MRSLRVIELFAGVGGFRLGLENIGNRHAKSPFKVVWSNQWEPATKVQHASDVYVQRFGREWHSNQNISQIDGIRDIPDHDLLVGGFPCQDYSVAKPKNQARGIIGEKGVLWWEIHRILTQKRKRNSQPNYLMLENVDRLLKSPASQRGRDFAIILASLWDLGYAVEWRVINAADYGFPQRRRRIFILGYHQNSPIYQKMAKSGLSRWINEEGVFAQAFPVSGGLLVCPPEKIEGGLATITKNFNAEMGDSPFHNSGAMFDREFVSFRTRPVYTGKRTLLGDILQKESEVPEQFFLRRSDISQWKYLKGAKHLFRVSKKTGKTVKYDEGAMIFPDALDRPSRTIITGEGGPSPSRFKHVVKTSSGRLRRLTPIELERLNMFPDDHTAGQSDVRRAFFMGNALVVGVIEKLGRVLYENFTATTNEPIKNRIFRPTVRS
jgi:DNA (cytosine-5)-methyltransferase 1